MIKPGPRNLITDLDGLLIGNAEDHKVRTGTTILMPEEPAAMAVDVRGGGPGTRDTEALDPTTLVEGFHALVLSGGSVFGLAAADGATAWLSEHGKGLPLGPRAVPVVPSAILFDLMNGGDKDWGDASPYFGLGRAACEALGHEMALGNVGAGLGATAGPLKGGLGSTSAFHESGIEVGALVAVNSSGEVVIPGSRTFWAWVLEEDGEVGGQSAPAEIPRPLPTGLPQSPTLGTNTTIGAVATNVALDKAQLRRVAMMAQDGFARAIRPAHTPFDGDAVFALSTGRMRIEVTPPLIALIGAMAADALARAVMRGVYEAEALGGIPAYRG